MQFETLKEIRRGNLVFKVLRSSEDGKRFVAVDRWNGHTMIRGPMLSERNFERLWRVAGDHIAPGLVVSNMGLNGIGPFHSGENEIEEAVQMAKTKELAGHTVGITVIPSTPEYRYVNTCPQCNCHTASYAHLGVGTSVKMCSGCGRVYSVSG